MHVWLCFIRLQDILRTLEQGGDKRVPVYMRSKLHRAAIIGTSNLYVSLDVVMGVVRVNTDIPSNLYIPVVIFLYAVFAVGISVVFLAVSSLLIPKLIVQSVTV